MRNRLAKLFLATGIVCALPLAALAEERPRIKDAKINSAVQTELDLDDAVAAHFIDVSTTDGIVRLEGSVSNILMKDRAVARAETVEGVRAVVDRIEVNATPRTDAQIRHDLENALLMDPVADSYEVDVAVDDAEVLLTGKVDSYAEKEMCSTIAKGIRGVKSLENEIRVKQVEDRPDAEIQAEIRRRLENAVWVDDALISVDVDDGKVILSGTAGSAAERSRAATLAWVMGVDAVDDEELEAKAWARDEMRRERPTARSDAEIEKAVEDAFLYDPRVLSFKITPSAENGVVTLTGVVDNLKAKRAAETDALHTAGVWRVKNHIAVRPDAAWRDRPASDIADEVRFALLRDPYVERFEIAVTAYHGEVYLNGTVDTQYEKQRAGEVASGVKGVASVVNNLTVTDAASTAFRHDWEIRDDIEDQLDWSPFVDEDDVTVKVDDGVATLTGGVESWRESLAATENAFEAGAERVVNKLKIKRGPDYTRP